MANAQKANGAFVNHDSPAYAEIALPITGGDYIDDPRLDGYVTEALRANTDLRTADANWQRADAAIARQERRRRRGRAWKLGSLIPSRVASTSSVSPTGATCSPLASHIHWTSPVVCALRGGGVRRCGGR